MRIKVILEEDIDIPDGSTGQHHAAGSELDVSMRLLDNPAAAAVAVADTCDRIRVLNCYAVPATKRPGSFYFNIRGIELVQSCWELDHEFLVLQPIAAGHKFIMVSRSIKALPTKTTAGLFSRMVWPESVSLMTKEKGERPFLHFRLQYAPWAARRQNGNDDKDDEEPVVRTFSLKLWSNQCHKMIPGGELIPLNDWKLLMERGTNPIPFVALCSLEPPNTKWANKDGDEDLHIHEFRANFASYADSPSNACPSVSEGLVKSRVKSSRPPAATAATTGKEIVNLSVTGFYAGVGGAFPTFRAMTSSPAELTDEQAIVDALESGAVSAVHFFAIPSENAAHDKEPKPAKQPKKK